MTEENTGPAPTQAESAPPANGLRRYRVLDASGKIAGQRRKKGETLELTAAQAKYHLPPYGSDLEPFEATSKKR